MTETSLSVEPVINVIEQDIRGLSGAVEQSGSAGRTEQLDAAAMDAVSARRRREFDAARSRLRDQAVRDDVEVIRQPDASPGTNAPSKGNATARAPLDQPPERVRKRYLRAGNQYFLKDAPYQLAFEDLGPYLVTEHNRPDVVESMVDIASAKSWTRIRVSGHEAFRAEVWLQGTLLGIEVSGYEPKAADLARLADARQARPKNRMEVDASMPPAGTQSPPDDNSTLAKASTSPETHNAAGSMARPDPARSEDQPRPYRVEPQVVSDEPETPRQYAGELREHGRAPYLQNPERSDSYYVAFRDARGTGRVVWGVDLERAMLASRAEPGDHVTLENLGRRIVPIKVPILDNNGTVVGGKEKDVYRNTWQVDVVHRERLIAGSVDRSEGASGMSTASVDPSAREGRQAHRPSTVTDEDRVLHLAVLVGAMREQGFSARSIARVRQRAEDMLDAFGREGITVPRPRVFDPEAPSERDRRARAAGGRVPARETERELVRTPAEPSPAR
ncbi:LPD7 domain-containing protein [Paraburkholderia sediminicola]|uniref:LPD7 domain-containing protein n=1 Tax=Paraburkholderia sediminicola TaxID=458836 RepID=UPI000E75199F